MTESYESLHSTKEAEVRAFADRCKMLESELERAEAVSTGKLEVLESSHRAQIQTAVENARAEWKAALQDADSTSTSTRVAMLERELASQSNIVSALEETLRAKDDLLQVNEKALADASVDAQVRMSAAVQAKEDEIRREMSSELDSAQDRASMAEKAYVEKSQRILADKQAELDAALETCRQLAEKTQVMSTESSACLPGPMEDVRSPDSVEETNQDAADQARQTEIQDLKREAEVRLEQALQAKDREMTLAMDLAQQEVDRLLEDKQIEVDALLDERDLVIQQLRVKLAYNVFDTLSEMPSTDATIQQLQEALQLKCDENSALERVLEKARADLEAAQLSKSVQELIDAAVQQEKKRCELASAAKEAELKEMMEQMQSALTEAMSAKGDLLCLDECATAQVIEKITKEVPEISECAEETLARLEAALTTTDPSVNREVVRLKLEIARLRKNGVSEEVIARLHGMTENALQETENRASITAKRTECVDSGTQTVGNNEKDSRVADVRAALKVEQQARAAAERKYNDLFSSVAELQRKANEYDVMRRKLLNTIQELKGNVRVLCRVRPLLPTEAGQSNSHIQLPADMKSGKLNLVDHSRHDVRGNRTEKVYTFDFTGLFGPDSTQAEVFEELKQLIQCGLLGFNVCVFAYGQTGSGKTYTMSGEDTEETRGMIPRTIDFLYEEIEVMKQRGWEFKTFVSFVEIYNETLRDLLDESDSPKELMIKTSKSEGLHVTNLIVEEVRNARELSALLKTANANRAVAWSDMNAHSSRSHSICQLVLQGVHAATGEKYRSKLNMVDLAGSERLTVPSAAEIMAAKLDERQRLQEEADTRTAETLSINKSLSTLASVIQSIRSKSKHVPYRDSKLTYILQDALGGDCKTMMMVNVSPAEGSLTETLCSLRFGAKTQCLVNDARRGSGGGATSSNTQGRYGSK